MATAVTSTPAALKSASGMDHWVHSVAVVAPGVPRGAEAAGLFAAAPYSPLEWATLIAHREYGL